MVSKKKNMEQMREQEGWYGATLETEKQDIRDPATGGAIILRQFKFAYAPWQKTKPKKKEILTQDYVKHLENILWADNMEMVTFPKVHFDKKGFTVFAACKPKKGNIIPGYAIDALSKPLHERLAEKDNG